MLDKKTLDPVVKDLKAWADSTREAIRAELAGAPFGLERLNDEEFLVLMEMRRRNLDWMRWTERPEHHQTL